MFGPGDMEESVDAETFARLLQNASQVDSRASVLKILMDAGLEFRRLYGVQLEHVARKGIASLPDELFALIFKIAALSNGTGQAVLLSHVSRRFREVALGEHHLWATLHSGATRDELETFISRSGFNTDLHVVIHVTPRYFNPHAFISVCWPTAQRWKTLTISEADDLQPNNATALFILKTIDRSYDLRLPHLQELYIGHHRVHGARHCR